MIPSGDSSNSRQKKIVVWAVIVLLIGTIIWLFLFLRHPARNITSQAPTVGNLMQSPVAQSGGQAGNFQVVPEEETHSALKDLPRSSDEPAAQQTPRSTSRPFVENPIRSIALNVRFTYETESGLVFPPEVPLLPLGDANDTSAYLEGPDGTVRLDFIGPVRFEEMDDRHIVVVNNFFLPRSSDLYGSSAESLKKFDFISMPIIATGYESSLKTMVSIRCLLEFNRRYTWTWTWSYGFRYMPGEQGETTIRIPITEPVRQLLEKK